MKEPRFSDEIILFDVSEGRVLPVLASLFFLAVGGTIVNFVLPVWNTDPVFLAVGAFGVLALVLPVWLLARVFAEARHPLSPQSLVFDQQDRRFRVWSRRVDEQKYSTDKSSLPGYDYRQLRSFGLRTWVTSGTDNTSSTRIWIVTLEKVDGSTWDLYHTTSKNDAEKLRDKLSVAVLFGGSDTSGTNPHSSVSPAMPSNPLWQTSRDANGPLWYWSRPAHLVSSLFGLVVVLAMAVGFTWVALEWVVIAVLGDVVFLVFVVLLCKGLVEGWVSLRNFRALRLAPDKLEVGLVPKNDSARFTPKKSLNLQGIRQVRFSFSLHEKHRSQPELELVGDQTLKVPLEGLSAGDAVALESEVEQALKSAGVTAL